MKVVYMGTPQFAVPALEALISSNHSVLGVVCQPDRKSGRGNKLTPPPVKVCAMESHIPVFQPERIKDNREFLLQIKDLSPDVIVVAAYGRILPKELLELPPFGCINIHGSILPKFRGAAPIQEAILSGDEKTGITIMKMEEGLDTGDIISISEVEIGKKNYPLLTDELAEVGAKLLLETMEEIEKAGEVRGTPQEEALATYAAMIGKNDGLIDFGEKTAAEIERMVRAYEPWPGAYTYIEDSILKIKKAEAIEENVLEGAALSPSILQNYRDLNTGTFLGSDEKGIYIKAKNSILQVIELQPQGKKPMDSGSYLRGHSLDIGFEFNGR